MLKFPIDFLQDTAVSNYENNFQKKKKNGTRKFPLIFLRSYDQFGGEGGRDEFFEFNLFIYEVIFLYHIIVEAFYYFHSFFFFLSLLQYERFVRLRALFVFCTIRYARFN